MFFGSRYSESAGTVMWGFGLLAVGFVLLIIGQQQTMRASLVSYGSSDVGTGLIGAGVIVGLIGLVTFLIGIRQLATNVDIAAKVASEVLRERELAAYDDDEGDEDEDLEG